MKLLRLLCTASHALLVTGFSSFAQTDGAAKLQVRVLDYNGSSTKHWTVVWVTTGSGAFIKTLWKQGPSITASHWNSHCRQWYDAKAGVTALDGYSSATAQNYSGTNSPVILTWNCRNAANGLVPDGPYKFWVQYAEDNGQGPYTTSGLIWNKGQAGITNTYPNQGASFANMQVTWTPVVPPPVAPTITSLAPGSTAIVGVPYSGTCTATGTAPIAFAADGLPTGLVMSPAGAISGVPTESGIFNGTITASNGTTPNATQLFSIAVTAVPVNFVSLSAGGNGLVLRGTGPPNGIYCVLISTNLTQDFQWTPIGTNTFDASGNFSFSDHIDSRRPVRLYRMRVP